MTADPRVLALAVGADERRQHPATSDLDALRAPQTAAETRDGGEAAKASAAELQARISLARGLISHRLDMSDPNVRLLDSVLAGVPIAQLVAREVR